MKTPIMINRHLHPPLPGDAYGSASDLVTWDTTSPWCAGGASQWNRVALSPQTAFVRSAGRQLL